MFNSVQEAIEALAKNTCGDNVYLQACEFLVSNRDQLTYGIYINLPGGLRGNSDSTWDQVKAGSEERCSCGNERVIMPLNIRREFSLSSLEPIIISPGMEVYLKPVGGDLASTYFKLWIENEGLAFMGNPFAPLVFSFDLLSTKGYTLEMLAEALPAQPKPPVMMTGKKIPVFVINSVDLETSSVTISLDDAVESFDPPSESGLKHECATS